MPATVLIAEDNRLNRMLFVEVIRDAGFNVIEARDGSEAMARVRNEAPDAMLLDMNLPQRSGLAVLRELRASDTLASLPVIAVSAFASAGDRRVACAAGCDRYLTKPVRPARLVETVREALAGVQVAG